ncbi:MAG: phosphoenolpyruvate carboxykinase (ATP) [Bacteroidetes bacterium CG02_land_8_20_14_3_00_31_25]|nr:MAG: phosphoenolpyruvate carboxykinase (ATP) [Bacteroidetes bacterium CG02_land_8_20_14_3_00_31_25]
MKYLEFETPAQKHAAEFKSDYGLKNHGLIYLDRVFWNLPEPALIEEAVFRNEGKLVNGGSFLVHTGKWTARAANDKYFVREDSTENKIDWGKNNRPISQEKFNGITHRLQAFLQGEELFVQDVYAGADSNYRLKVRIITDRAWQSLFVRNVLITISDTQTLKTFIPDFTIIVSPSFKLDPRIDGTRTETGILIDFNKRLAIIANTKYAGEIKKCVFTIMNYLLPLQDVMAMHCSANVGKRGDVALFFGLSGTGKTTLSADPTRQLIGDDEHGWSDSSVFNIEGGCYAKAIRLSSEQEPEIHACTHKFGTILENVVFDLPSRQIDLDDEGITENTRISYPIDYIPNAVKELMVNAQPSNIIFLTCDAQGVMPPIARLSPEQAIYHFISGYTSKIAGTELGLGIEPEITFSACFGAPFMVHHPYFYANLLRIKMEKNNAKVWLVNTGWVGGKFGVGKRISIRHTRNMLNAALEGMLDNVKYRKDKLFGFDVPVSCPNVPNDVFEPSNAWGNKDEYWKKFDDLVARYIDNFKLFKDDVPKEILKAGPKRLK